MKRWGAFFTLYLPISLAVAVWWLTALGQNPTMSAPEAPLATHSGEPHPLIAQLSPFTRSQLQQALSGDFALMARLIADWEVDAQILEQAGISSVSHLSRDLFLRSQLLSRELEKEERQESHIKILPQTYAAAGIVLALASPDQIVALPSGMRRQEQLYSSELTRRVPLDIDRYNSEIIYEKKPDLAIISAYYSHPSAIEALRNQGIKILATDRFGSVDEIKQSLEQIGRAIGRPHEAELLTLFMDAALMAIDNRLLTYDPASPAGHVLYVTHHDRFYLPSSESIAADLLQRLGIVDKKFLTRYAVIEKEKIRSLNPGCLIVSGNKAEELQSALKGDPALGDVEALRSGRLFIVDDDIQQTPTHFAILAYFDLAQALAKASWP